MNKETVKKYFEQVLKGGLIGLGLTLGITFGVLSIYAFNWAGVSTATTSTNLTANMWNTTMSTLTGNIQTLEDDLLLRGVPSGAIMFFNLGACPSGWSELINARGRYIVGLNSGGSLGTTVGTSLSDLENRPVGEHNHGITDPGHRHGIEQGAGAGGITRDIDRQASSTSYNYSTTNTTGISINNTGSVSGTNAPYIQFLTCIKN